MEQQEIFDRMVNIMVDTFDLSRESITPESKILEDLDLDSLDLIDMLIELETLTGYRLEEAEFRTVRTVGDVVDLIHARLAGSGSAAAPPETT
ncbi:MAG: acyl carrier protein [Myxococcales bacterium]|nr:acyl carrier protein [Myxococcales bacterium]MCB9708886.1 acyl carrier protein [Myxococcales bacterium]